MKKFIYNIYLLAALFLTVTACTKEDSVLDSSAVEKEQPVNKTYTMTVNATKGEEIATTRALSLSDKTLTATWATGENVYVFKGSTQLTGTLNPKSNGVTAVLTGDITGDIVVNNELTFMFPRATIDYSGQIGTLADIQSKYDYAMATVKVTEIAGSNITTENATFYNQQAIIKFILKNKSDNSPIQAATLTIHDATNNLTSSIIGGVAAHDDITIDPEYDTNEIFASLKDVNNGTLKLTAVAGGKHYLYNKSSVTFNSGQYYEVTVKMSEKKLLSTATGEDRGKYVGTDGYLYESIADATAFGTNAVAVVVHISGVGHGLALALNDESTIMNHSNAVAAAAAHPAVSVTGATWGLPTKGNWDNMTEYLISHHQGLTNGSYWTNTYYSSDYYYTAMVSSNGDAIESQYAHNTETLNVRAVLAF